MKERLQKIISSCGVASRREAEKLIASGHVFVNGTVSAVGDSADLDSDEIIVNGVILSPTNKKLYIALNKPKGYITTVSDNLSRKTIMDLVLDVDDKVYPVGRLDMDSSGIILLTNDGEFANKVMHPSNEKDKIYHVKVTGNIEIALPLMNSAMLIDGYMIHPAKTSLIKNDGTSAVLEVVIHEGRNRQVRKMCQNADLKVLELNRVAIGEIKIGSLPLGKWRNLTSEEVASFK